MIIINVSNTFVLLLICFNWNIIIQIDSLFKLVKNELGAICTSNIEQRWKLCMISCKFLYHSSARTTESDANAWQNVLGREDQLHWGSRRPAYCSSLSRKEANYGEWTKCKWLWDRWWYQLKMYFSSKRQWNNGLWNYFRFGSVWIRKFNCLTSIKKLLY